MVGLTRDYLNIILVLLQQNRPALNTFIDTLSLVYVHQRFVVSLDHKRASKQLNLKLAYGPNDSQSLSL